MNILMAIFAVFFSVLDRSAWVFKQKTSAIYDFIYKMERMILGKPQSLAQPVLGGTQANGNTASQLGMGEVPRTK